MFDHVGLKVADLDASVSLQDPDGHSVEAVCLPETG
jgi:hypothetical protein